MLQRRENGELGRSVGEEYRVNGNISDYPLRYFVRNVDEYRIVRYVVLPVNRSKFVITESLHMDECILRRLITHDALLIEHGIGLLIKEEKDVR